MGHFTLRHAFALTTAVLLAWLCIHSVPARAGGQCTAQETTYFSCDTARHKAISLCGATPSALQYRYGKPPQVELKFPDKPSDGVNQLRYAHYTRFQVDRSEVTFSHGGVDYAVFDYTEQGKRTAGVHITLADGSEHEVQCAGPIEGRLSTLAKSLRCDADNALNGGNCP
ncbi:MAG TPA: hypothetical protein VME63_15750 [Dyella sp.]|uniref:hypothetical protein n=1 Tax=Dyella sp. TaxID=1869338 RepID=UPI002C9B0F1F|nr:hypothetical protein [Dyella sp.]HTV86854.1 hypothetical protein [Dyella sp.]